MLSIIYNPHSKKNVFRLFSISLILLGALSLNAQQIKELNNLWPVKGSSFYQGFNTSISGTELDFFPFLEAGNIALYLGENGKYTSFEMETEAIPTDYDEPFITFIWSCGIAKSVEPEKSEFMVTLNEDELVTINSQMEESPQNWEFTANNGTQLAFVTTSVGKANGDLFGYMFLNIPAKEYEKGKAITLKFDETRSNDRDYYMAIQNPVRETLKILAEPAILKTENGPKQSIKINLTHLGQPTKGRFSVNGKKIIDSDIQLGSNEFNVLVEPVSSQVVVDLNIKIEGKETISRKVELKPVRNFEVYFLPHSHVDIGFTHRQAEVAELQWKNLDLAIDLAEQTANYPEGSRYKWNAEISWVLDGYLKQASSDRKEKFLNAVNNGSIGIDALYGSTLTGIQTEEELFNNTLFANDLINEYGFDIQSGMITDVPGYTWGICSWSSPNRN